MNKKLSLLTSTVLTALLTSPVIAFAAFNPIPEPNVVPGITVWDILNAVLGLVWPIMAAVAVIMFIIAAFLFLTSSGDPAKVGAARQSVVWAVAGLGIALISFSIPYIVRNVFTGIGV